MPTSGTRPLSRANSVERAAVEPGDDRHVDVARAPAAALGEQHHRQPAPLGELEQAVLLEVVAHALRAGQHRVVVGHRHARRGRRSRRRPPTSPSAGVRAISSSRERRRSWAANSSGPYSTKRALVDAGRRGSRAPCAARARGAARPPPGAPRRGRSRGARAPPRRSARMPVGAAASAALGARSRACAASPALEHEQQLSLARPRRRPRPRRWRTTPPRLARAPRAPSSSPRARAAPCPRRPARPAACGERDDDARERGRHGDLRARRHGQIIAQPDAGSLARRVAGVIRLCANCGPVARCSSSPRLPGSNYHPADVRRARASGPPPSGASCSRRSSRRRKACTRCPELAATRKTVVFGAGNADADLMFVGEAPGASEDEQGVPFVGRAGQAARDAARGDRPAARRGLHREHAEVPAARQPRPAAGRDRELPGLPAAARSS